MSRLHSATAQVSLPSAVSRDMRESLDVTHLTDPVTVIIISIYIQKDKSDTSIWLGLLKGAILLSADPKSVL